jgi:PKD repeat protein
VIGINSGVAGDKLVTDYLTSNGLDLSEQSHVVLSFDYAFRRWQQVDKLHLMYRVFEESEWINFAEIRPTKSYTDWANYKAYLPAGAMKENVQIAFFYTDQGEVGYGTLIDNIELYAVEEPGNPDFELSSELICQGGGIVYTDMSSGTKDSYLWNFGSGASPRTAETEGPHHVTYSSGGSKTVTLTLNGLDETIKEEVLIVSKHPAAKFTNSINDKTVSFTNTSTNAESYFWDFGDGSQMDQESPEHIYEFSGDYLVKLIAINSVCGNDTTEQWISFNIAGENNISQSNKIEIFPNPANEKLYIELPQTATGTAKIHVYNIQGQKVLNRNIDNVTYSDLVNIDISDIPGGTYFLQIICDNKIYQKKFQKTN